MTTPLPPVVYVPSELAQPGDDEVTLQLRALEDGRLALLVFSALDRLVDGCGTAQPWVLIPSDRLEDMRTGSGAAVVLLDTPLHPEQRQDGAL